MGVTCKLYDTRALPVRDLELQKRNDCKERLLAEKLNIPFQTLTRTEIHPFCDTQYGQASIDSPLAYQCPNFGENFHLYTYLNSNMVLPNALPVEIKGPLFPHQYVPQ